MKVEIEKMMKESATFTSNKKEVSLFSLFGKEKLYSLQEKLAKATGLSFFVIDYKGEAVTNHIIQNDFCKGRKKNEPFCSECTMIFAMAAAKAAILNKPYIFSCEKNLLSIAVPVIVNNQYLGALIGGQVRCKDVDDDKLVKEMADHHFESEDNYAYQDIPVMPYERLKAISELAYFLINEMAGKENGKIRIAELEHKEVHLKDLRRKNSIQSNTIKKLEIENMRMDLPSHFLINMFVTASNFAVLENASQTEEIMTDSVSILRYYLERGKDNIELKKELYYIEKFLGIIKKQYMNRFNYRIQCEESLEKQEIPSMSLFPFLEYIVNFGILSRSFKGNLFIDAERGEETYLISMQMKNELTETKIRNHESTIFEEADLKEQIRNAQKRLNYKFEEECGFTVQNDYITIEIPLVDVDGEAAL